jgi:hypothetical protein
MKGFVFSSDMLIALSMVFIMFLGFFLFRFETSTKEREFETLSYVSEDIINVLSELKINEVQSDPVISNLISTGSIKASDMNKTLIDLITSYWYGDQESTAFSIADSILTNITNEYCVRLTIDDGAIYSSCDPIPTNVSVSVSSRIETGYEMGRPTFGYISRAYLASLSGKKIPNYIYFGGYEGQGNLTKTLTLPSNLNVIEIIMELDAGGDFDLYINGNHAGFYSPTAVNMTADRWVICDQASPSYCNYVNPGQNIFKLNFTEWNDSYVGGGYIKVVYETQEFSENETGQYDFPGIYGLINLFSSFNVPGKLNSMEASLHYKSYYPIFLNIGNTTVYNDSSVAETTVTINNSTLFSLLDYNYFTNKTVPLRLGTEASDFIETGIGIGDSILVTDLSGSMEECSSGGSNVDYGWTTWQENGITYGGWRWEPDGTCDGGVSRNIELAQEANNIFINIVLNITGNQIGLVDYSGSGTVLNFSTYNWFTKWPDHITGTHDITDDGASLSTHVNSTESWWGTCICCGINRAVEMMNDQSNSSRTRSLVLMTDGEANIRCSQQGTGNARNDMIQAGQDACALGIDVYTVGYGDDVDAQSLEQTACNPSMYYDSSNVSELASIYRSIAEKILEGSYTTQTINLTGEAAKNNTLFPDSYIKFNYTQATDELEYGEIFVRKETDALINLTGYFANSSYTEAGFFVPSEITPTKARVTSYSSTYWTDRLYVDNETWDRIYWLGDYGNDYSQLGDPFIVNIPSGIVKSGKTNYIRIGTGISTSNATGASDFDRVIYDAILKGSVGYGEVFETQDEADDDARARLIQKIQTYVDIDADDIEIETESVVNMRWLWGPSLIKISAWNK